MVTEWNINAKAQQLTPQLMNQPPQSDWIATLLSALVALWTTYQAWMISTQKLATYTVSTIKLQAMLNDFGTDPVQRRIIINNTWFSDPYTWVGLEVEQPPIYIGLSTEPPFTYIGTQAEYTDKGDFQVICAPGSLTANQILQIKATVAQYIYPDKVPYYMYSNGVPF